MDFELYSTESCPFCPKAEKLLETCNIPVRVIMNASNEVLDEHEIRAVPTLIAGSKRFVGLGEIRDFVNGGCQI